MQCRDRSVSSQVCRIHEVGKVGDSRVVVKSRISELLQKTLLQLDGDLLERNDRDMISFHERVAKSPNTASAFFLNLFRRLIDALFEQSRWLWRTFEGSLLLDLLDDRAAVVKSLCDSFKACLARNYQSRSFAAAYQQYIYVRQPTLTLTCTSDDGRLIGLGVSTRIHWWHERSGYGAPRGWSCSCRSNRQELGESLDSEAAMA